jgi:ParB family chromosome partitioning protein
LKISIDKIVVSKDNPRQSFDEEGLRRLGESIKEHGQLQAVIVRTRGSGYELVVGERRLRACALVGINDINAEIRDIDDCTTMELRLIENTQREDLSDAEKGDAVLSLWANYDKYNTLKDVADAIHVPPTTVVDFWVAKARKLSPNVRDRVASASLTDEHARVLLKYPHFIQDKLAKAIIKHGISSHKEVLRRFTKLYDENPHADLDELANKVLGIETVTIPKTELTEEQKKKIAEEKIQLAKIQKVRKKPSKPITKEDVQKQQKKTDFKFVKATVSHGQAGLLPQLKMEVKPTILPNPSTPDYTLCKCALCPLFATHCKGRCWT